MIRTRLKHASFKHPSFKHPSFKHPSFKHHCAAVLLVALFASSFFARESCAGDWFFQPSTFSHSPTSGQRVRQYAPIPPVIVYQRPDYTRSGFRQQRSTIRAGGSIDHYHVVEQFGDVVRPYGEWLYPYRPYSVPYDAWGPPFGGVNGEFSSDAHLRSRDPRARFDGGRPRYGYPYGDAYDRRRDDRGRDDRGRDDRGRDDRHFRGDRRFDARIRERERFNGLFDGRGIPGDDEHYLDPPSRLDRMDDREFFSPPRSK